MTAQELSQVSAIKERLESFLSKNRDSANGDIHTALDELTRFEGKTPTYEVGYHKS